LIHDLGDLSYMVEKFTRDPKLLRRADDLLDRRVKALRSRKERRREAAQPAAR
jgi:hypothetical protein